MILDVDIGNSRIKWRLSCAGKPHASGSVGHAQQVWDADIAPTIASIQRVRVSNVAGSDPGQAFARWVQDRFGVRAEFAVSLTAAAGVTNGYVKPETLGVDRWLGILATWDRFRSASVIVDAGSAITLDIVADDGCHLGGYIVPGLRMMQRALYTATSAVKVDTEIVAATGPGHSTREAVLHGSLAMAAALVDRTSADFPTARIMLSGGDADILARFIGNDAVIEPDLVLDGLALALP